MSGKREVDDSDDEIIDLSSRVQSIGTSQVANESNSNSLVSQPQSPITTQSQTQPQPTQTQPICPPNS